MHSCCALLLAGLLDWLFGDPRWLPHPVRLLGALIDTFEQPIRKYIKKPAALKFAGSLLALTICALSVLLTCLALFFAYRLHPAAGFFVQTYLYFAFLAAGDLRHHVKRVKEPLKKGDIKAARKATSMLVSRDTSGLGPNDLTRATLESLFESSADGLVAPLFFAALFGPAGAAFCKAVNTLDSMIGYKNERYLHLGWFAAKLDDVVNYLPARLTALLIMVAGALSGNFVKALSVLKENRFKHDSPNSAWPEAAAAGVLGVRFGGADYYQGALVKNAVINPQGSVTTPLVFKPGLYLYYRTVFLAYLVLLPLSWGLGTLEVCLF